MEDELWLKKIKERLDDYAEPVPASGWKRLEKDFPFSGSSMKKIREERSVLRRWVIAVAAILLLAVSSLSLWLMNSSVGEEIRRASPPALVSVPSTLPPLTAPTRQTDVAISIRPKYRNSVTVSEERHPALLAQQAVIATDDESEKKETTDAADEISVDKQATESVMTAEEQPKNDAGTKREERHHRPSGKDKLHLSAGHRTASGRTSREWAIGLYVGNTGGLSLNKLNKEINYIQAAPKNIFNGGRMDLSFASNAILSIPQGENLVFKDGMPYLQSDAKNITSIEHKQPFSLGISVRKELVAGFAVESGVTYTYLASDVSFERSSDKLRQKLHYIGIPIRVSRSIINTRPFTLYATVGGAIEKCVYGKIGSENETVEPLQLSVTGAVGAQYNLNKRLGLYVEPGISYFFDDGSAVQTTRKENPCNFTLQAGVRLTY